MRGIFFPVLSLAVASHASPHVLSSSHRASLHGSSSSHLLERQDEPQICTYKRGDPSAMRETKSDQYLSDFLNSDEDNAWADRNWLAALDEKTTKSSDGGPYHSTLNCSQIEDRAHCTIPDQDVQCRWFTPPEVYWIRLWAPNFQTFMDAARNSLVEQTLIESLSVNKLTEDFDLGDMNSEDKNLPISAVSWLIAPLLGFAGAFKPFLGVSGTGIAEVSSLLGNVAENIAGGANLALYLNSKNQGTPPTPRQLALVVENVYKEFFTTARDNIKALNRQFFSGLGDGEDDKVSAFAASLEKSGASINRGLHPIAQVLGSGEFASGGSGNLEDVLKAGYKMFRDQMVGAVLATQGVVLFAKQNGNQDECGWGTWFDNGVCHRFVKTKLADNGVLESSDVDEAVLKRIQNDYGISIEDMIKNIRSCGNDFDRKPNLDVSMQANYPACHFGMAYFSADDEPCKMWPGPYGFEHAGCRDSYEEMYWNRFKAGEEVQRQGSYPGATLQKWMVPKIK